MVMWGAGACQWRLEGLCSGEFETVQLAPSNAGIHSAKWTQFRVVEDVLTASSLVQELTPSKSSRKSATGVSRKSRSFATLCDNAKTATYDV